ncbi:cGMP-dependent 3',5'-cyclic phosphodiesterase isoform X2 [Halyomorpha halys]|uniref:cGMP-dependent 3',5'-cyclic phosphodiesterase isoform X2 n=1 Tax=Halyomorpha halys TaxID=286706 RepID=UPI0006D4E794|nr:cGMP-dependent 3',5'-cyclic phosphodiesterase-like isoform X2 [Halyomorpha halys]
MDDTRSMTRDITEIQRNHEKKTKKSRRLEFLRLFYSNPQKLLHLIKELYDDNTISQQKKVNLYLQEETGCILSFLIEKCQLYKEHHTKVIGSRELMSQVRFEENNDFIRRLQSSDVPITLMKELLDKNLLGELNGLLDDFKFTKDVKCHSFPIYHPYRKNVILYACLVQDVHVTSDLKTMHGFVGECFRYCQEIIVNTMRYDEQKLYHKKEKEILELGISNLDIIDNFHAFMRTMRHQILEISDAERCNVFILEGNVLVSRICEHGVAFDTLTKAIQNVRIPIGVGIPGIVAETGKTINCLDPEHDQLFKKDIDVAGGLLTRNSLSFPLMLYERVYGVVEVINKTNCSIFSGADISHCECLGKVLGIQLYMALITKKNRDDYSRRNLIDFIMLETPKIVSDNEIYWVENCQVRHDYTGFVDYMFIPSSVPIEHNMCTCLHMFEDLHLLPKMEINRLSFIRFLLTVRNRHHEFSFHGWGHAFNTLHFIYTIIKKENILHNDTVTAMECFCMMLAAICHEMEYYGPVTPFKPTCGSTLGSLYSSAGSVVQFHSIDQTVRLLEECGIINNLDLKRFKEFLLLLDAMILGMDLGNYIYIRSNLKKLIEERKILKGSENRRHYFGILLTCSNISDFCKPWHYLEAQGAKICEEFFAREVPQECYGLIEFGDILENVKLKKILLQIHFMQNICEPAFSLLNTLLPRTDRCSENIEYNIRTLMGTKEKLVQAQLEQTT